MLDLYYWPTPNGHKITIFLEETQLPYRIVPVNIGIGDQFHPDFLKISPNNKMPAIVDHDPEDHKQPLSIFESGAILVYLADKTNQLLPQAVRPRFHVLEWLFWQAAGLGPMAGQNHHFTQYANETIQYAINRYVNETSRLYAVLNKQLHGRDFIANDYSIADIACYPWIVPHKKQLQNLDDYPHLKSWFERISNRAAVIRAYEKGQEINTSTTMTEEAKKILFGQNAKTIKD